MTMEDLLTFFQPGDDAGTAWTFSSPSTQGPRGAWAYVPREVDLSQFANREVSSQEHFNQLLEETQEEIEKHGGILVEARAHNEVIRLTLFSGNGAPRKMLRLRPVGDPRFESFSTSADLEAGEHFILPVSAAAQQKLETFESVSRGFPADLRSTLFNVIRRPSLEWRIQRIEEMLSLEAPTQAEQQKSRQRSPAFRVKLPRWLLWPIPAGLVAAAVVLLAGAFVGYKLWPGDAAVTEDPSTTTPEPEKEPTTSFTGPNPKNFNPDKGPATETGVPPAPAQEPKAYSKLKESLPKLSQALINRPEKSAIGKIYKSHFEGHAGREFENGSPVVWGITKLEALRLGLIQETDPIHLSDGARTPFKTILENLPRDNKLTSDTKALELLAWSACQRYQKPVLMVNDQDQEPFPFKNGNCDTIKPEDALSGLEDLTTWVTSRQP